MKTLELMTAAVLVAEGEPETAIEVTSVDLPRPVEGEVRVQITHAALNHLDVWIRKGMPSVPKPRIMGGDGAGVIDAIAGESTKSALLARGLGLGDRVLIDPGLPCGDCAACSSGDTSLCDTFRVLGEHVAGTHAQYVVVPMENVHPVPGHLDDRHAAALSLAFGTAWRMLFTRAQVRAGERVLVWGGSAGVGAAALQLCAAAGVETVATTRSADKIDELRELGAGEVVMTDGGDLPRELGSFDVAFDHLGDVAWAASMRALRKGGRYVTCGATTGANPPAGITRLFWKQLSMLGSTMASRRDVAEMLAFVTEHRIAPRVDTSFPLERIAEAHRYLEASSQVGKVVLDVG